MTGKVLENGATGALILILPIALILVVLFTAWPVLLALLVLGLAWKFWQHYRWKRWSKQVNPFFYQLIKENQGCLTPMDLSLKANLSGSAAQWFLEKKAEEYGAQHKVYEDKGTVYYFLTAGALGSIFEDSEPLSELESEEIASEEPSQLGHALAESESLREPSSEPSVSEVAQLLKSERQERQRSENETSPQKATTEEVEDSFTQKTEPEASTEELDLGQDSSESLIQAELAKRLDVHSSTVGKRKSDPDFAEWSQSRDPEGVAWEYSPETKMFVPLDNTQK